LQAGLAVKVTDRSDEDLKRAVTTTATCAIAFLAMAVVVARGRPLPEPGSPAQRVHAPTPLPVVRTALPRAALTDAPSAA
jgi:hypothetical protein